MKTFYEKLLKLARLNQKSTKKNHKNLERACSSSRGDSDGPKKVIFRKSFVVTFETLFIRWGEMNYNVIGKC